MKYTHLSDFYKKHSGETIYLIGNGPSATEISDTYKNEIQRGISIGVNSSQLWGPTTYQAVLLGLAISIVVVMVWSLNVDFIKDAASELIHLKPMGEATTVSPSFFSDNNTLYITQHMHNPTV